MAKHRYFPLRLDIFDYECTEKSHDNYSLILVEFTQDEVNQPQKDGGGKGVAETEDIDDEHFTYCPKCQQRNGIEASFCVKCGTRLHQGSANYQEPANDYIAIKKTSIKDMIFMSLADKIKPFLFIVVGLIIGVCFYTIKDLVQQKSQIAATAKSQLHDISSKQKFENASIAFITKMCSLDSAKTAKDSILDKDIILSKYLEFCKDYNNKNCH